MKKNGFTLIEVIAVIIIISILASLAVTAVSRYKQDVNKKELVVLHSTIEAAYDKYRTDALIKGGDITGDTYFNDLDSTTFNKYFGGFSYNGKHLTQDDLIDSVIKPRVKGVLLNTVSYLTEQQKDGKVRDENDYVKDEVCLAEAGIVDKKSEKKDIENKCKKDGNGRIISSKAEILCVKLVVEGEELINDFGEKSMQPLCKYFK